MREVPLYLRGLVVWQEVALRVVLRSDIIGAC